ncbi:signal peptidase complex subunit 3B [Micractinium conductrix]|uniref:Signal peptidase complex subunit 3 n=1 Tax=Micractinium conductrix TaxID=554055 RepID=A0A2P6V946_9CHLO|nr:signal peptidase complex subunit 3B [Micractinium conductrix]|eukprot:PSC70612.1 signal peptidase complex subunit 3B [Micractinium conductrix]
MSHSWLSRANALATFAGTVLAVVCLAVTATDYFHKSQPVLSCEFVGTEGLQKEFGHDRAHVVLNLTADLRSEFSWNTKQLFVFVDFEFATRKNARNQMVMWSANVLDKEHALIRVPTLRAQYPYALTDQGFGLRDREFNITVGWNVMPRVGALFTRRRTFAGLGPLPDEYFQPTAGRVRRPGSDEFVEVPTGGAEEDADPYYTDA